MAYLATLLCAALFCVSTASAQEHLLTMSLVPETAQYAAMSDDVQVRCTLSGEVNPFLTTYIIYKRQDESTGWKKAATFTNNVFDPWNENGDKYSAAPDPDCKTGLCSFILTIRGVDASDAGEYKCHVESDKGQFEASPVTLHVQPGDAGTLTLDVSNEAENDVYNFNNAGSVSCTGSAQTTSNELKLTVELDGVEITNDFVPEQWINWSDGQEGLKVPTASIKLQANNWQPKVGQVQLSCILHDGIKQVAIKTITVKHDATASIKCSTNYRKPIGIEDIDVKIFCEVADYVVSAKDLTLRWTFRHMNRTVNITTGQSNYMRIARYDADADKQSLVISRVMPEIIEVGNIAEYQVSLEGDDNKVVAETTFGLQIDATRMISGASSITAVSFLLGLCALVALL